MLKTTGWCCAPKLAMLAMLLTMSWSTARAGDGAVYMMTNEVAGNELAVFARDSKGFLEFPVFYQTGGTGTGGGVARGRSRSPPTATPSIWSTPRARPFRCST